MSDVEKFFYAIQKNMGGGNRKWEQLSPGEQMMFVQAINVILEVTEK